MELATEKPKNCKLHVMMFPWVAYGHFIPFLHLSNKLAERGHTISFLLPKSAQTKLQQQNQYPNLINFLPIVVPHVEGLPHGVEQFRCPISTSPSSLYHVQQDPRSVPSKRMDKDSAEPSLMNQVMKPPPDFPSSNIQINCGEASEAMVLFQPSGDFFFQDRLRSFLSESDAVAVRTCREIEGPFCDYLSQQFGKLVLLTGPALPETPTTQLEAKWTNWLNKFEVGSVVYCAFGSQITLQKDQFQDLVLGFELSGLPFLVALSPPQGCATVEEALPEGFEERVEGRGWVYGGWVPQPLILKHPSIGCFVSHCGFGSMWESLLSECQVVLIPYLIDQIIGTKLMVDELKVAVEVERGENRWVAKESLRDAIKMVMDKESVIAANLKSNHAKLRNTLSSQTMQENYIDSFIQSLHDLLDSQNQKHDQNLSSHQ